MKKHKISYRKFSGSGPLSITWFPGPLGDAIEDRNGLGVGFFAHNGDLLSVEFDDVKENTDQQELIFENGAAVLIKIKSGKIIEMKVTLPKRKAA